MYIYLITNVNNDKKYVGQTVRDKIEDRFTDHVYAARTRNHTLLGNAINKYGKDKFKIEPLHICESKEEMDFVEMFYISFLNTKSPNGYNLSDGGEISRLGCKKTHCIAGHEFSKENTRIQIINGTPRQICKACKRDWARNNGGLKGLRLKNNRNQNSYKTMCIRGHKFTEENTRIKMQNGKPHRVCRACHRAYYHEIKNRRVII